MKKSLLTVFLVIITCVMLGAKPDTTFLDFAEKLADNSDISTFQIDMLCDVAYEFYLSGDKARYDSIVSKALNKSKEEKNKRSKISEILDISILMAKTGETENALIITKLIPEEDLNLLFIELSISYAKKGNFSETLKMLKKIKEEFLLQDTIAQLKKVLIERKEYNNLIFLVENYTNNEQRFNSMLDVFILMSKEYKPDILIPLIKKYFPASQDRNTVYDQIIQNLDYNNIEIIKKYTEMFENQNLKNGYSGIISMFSEDYETALKYCNLINDDFMKTSFLSKIGVVLINQNKNDIGMKIINDTINKSDSIKNNEIKDKILSTMAVDLIDFNYPEISIKAAEKIYDSIAKDSLFTKIAAETANKLNFKTASYAAEKISSTKSKIIVYSEIARQMINNNKIEEGIKLFDKAINLFYHDSEIRIYISNFEIIAAEISKIKNPDTAKKITKLIPNKEENEEEIEMINNILSMIMIKNGRYDEAFRLFKNSSFDDAYSIVFQIIKETVEFLTRNNQFLKAIDLIRIQEDTSFRVELLILMHQTNLITKYDINADVKTALKKVIY